MQRIVQLLLLVSLTTSLFAQTTLEADFAARCSAPGVTACYGLDTEANLQAQEIVTASDDTRQGFIDTATKVSGAGSLKFTFRAGVNESNIGGAWSADMGHTFVSGQTMHVQYHFRFSPTYATNNSGPWGNSSIKHINLHGPSSTCQGSEFTTTYGYSQFGMYTNCGYGWVTNVNTNALQSSCPDDCLIQQGSNTVSSPNGNGYNCHYQNQSAGIGDGSGCFVPVANKWYTIYEKIQLGTFGGSNTVVEAWESHDGNPYKQFQRVSGVRWTNNRDNNFTRARLETYMTEISKGASVPAYIWYDELIVSTQPIAAPGTASPPPPPPPTVLCADGLDNDGDGLTDFPADPGCSSASDTDETNAPPPPSTSVIVTFDNPVPPGVSGSYMDSRLFQGISFGTQKWRWEGPYGTDPSHHIYFASAVGKSRAFTFSPGPKKLKSIRVFTGVSGTLTLTDNLGQTKVQSITTGGMQLVTTNWVNASTDVTVKFNRGWELGVDDIEYVP